MANSPMDVARSVTSKTDLLGKGGDLHALAQIVENADLSVFPDIRTYVKTCASVARLGENDVAFPSAQAVWVASWLVKMQGVGNQELALSYAKALKEEAALCNGNTASLEAAVKEKADKKAATQSARVKAGKTIPALQSAGKKHTTKLREAMVAGAPSADVVATIEALEAELVSLKAEALSRVSVNA